MQLGKINIHDAENMTAHPGASDGVAWVSLGEIRDGRFSGQVNLFFTGPHALARAERLAAAINEAMAVPVGSVVLPSAAE